jgi:hypothetical protein
MDDLSHAAELIERALEALDRAALTNPHLRDAFAQRSAHLRELRDEVEAAIASERPGGAPTR